MDNGNGNEKETEMKAMKFDLIVMSDLVRCGTNEDGEEIILPRWYPVAEDRKGYRYAAPMMFDTEGEAQDRRDQIARDGGVDPIRSGWFQMSPVYGSEAYQESGAEAELIAWENEMEGRD